MCNFCALQPVGHSQRHFWLNSLQVRAVCSGDSEAKRDKREGKRQRGSDAPGSPPHLGGEWDGVG